MPLSLTMLKAAGRVAVRPLSPADLLYIAQPGQSPKSRTLTVADLKAELRAAGISTLPVDLTDDQTLDITTNLTEELVLIITTGEGTLTLAGAPQDGTGVTVVNMNADKSPLVSVAAEFFGDPVQDPHSAAKPFHGAGYIRLIAAGNTGHWIAAGAWNFGGSDAITQLIGTQLSALKTSSAQAESALSARATALESVTSYADLGSMTHTFVATQASTAFAWFCAVAELGPGTYEVTPYLNIKTVGNAQVTGKISAGVLVTGQGVLGPHIETQEVLAIPSDGQRSLPGVPAIVTVPAGGTCTPQIGGTLPDMTSSMGNIIVYHALHVRRIK